MKMNRRVACAIALSLLVTACSSSDDEDAGDDATVDEGTAATDGAAVEGGSWTILQYSMADNNLEEFMIADLEELAEVGSQDGLNIRALVDRSAEESQTELADAGDWVGGRIFDVQQGSFEEVTDLGDANTGDPALLADFISQGITDNPADHYGLVISDHGASWPGIGPDDSFGDMLDLAELQQALTDGLAGAGVERLDVIGFDACLMASYEVASAMAPFADRMIASEELEPGHGWDYRSFQALADGADVDTFGRAVVDSFQEHAVENGTEQEITLSLLDLTQMGPLDEAMTAFAEGMAERGAAIAPVVGQQLANTVQFGRSADEAESSHVVDLRMLVSQIGVESLDLSSFTDEVERAINDVVLYSIDSPGTLGASGMTIYFPPADEYFDARYDEAPSTGAWSAFLAAYYGAGDAIPEAEQAAFVEVAPGVFFDEDGLNMQASYDPAAAANLAEAFIRYALVNEDGSLTYLGQEPASIFEDGTAQGIYDLTTLVITDGIDEATAFVDLSFDEEAGVGTIDVTIAYYAPGAEVGGPDYQDALLSIVFDSETGDVLQETYYSYDEETGGYGELDADPEGLIVPEVLVIGADGSEQWVQTSDVGLFADLPNLLYELRPHASGTLLQMELSVVDFGGNVDTVTAQATVP